MGKKSYKQLFKRKIRILYNEITVIKLTNFIYIYSLSTFADL